MNGSLNTSFASVLGAIGDAEGAATPNRSFSIMRSAVRAAIPKNFVKDRARAIEGIPALASDVLAEGGDGKDEETEKAAPGEEAVSSGVSILFVFLRILRAFVCVCVFFYVFCVSCAFHEIFCFFSFVSGVFYDFVSVVLFFGSFVFFSRFRRGNGKEKDVGKRAGYGKPVFVMFWHVLCFVRFVFLLSSGVVSCVFLGNIMLSFVSVSFCPWCCLCRFLFSLCFFFCGAVCVAFCVFLSCFVLFSSTNGGFQGSIYHKLCLLCVCARKSA